MSSRYPATVQLSFGEFSRHGGLTGPHSDGWGIAHYQGRDICLMKEATAASDSALADFLRRRPPTSTLFLSHIRKLTQGTHSFVNCQPMARELGGRMHVFAHNGDLERAGLEAALPLGRYRPLGDTDSERAFCGLMEQLSTLWNDPEVPSRERRIRAVANFASQVRPLGPANFVYSDGDLLLVHGHQRTQSDGGRRPPGVHLLRRTCRLEGRRLAAPGLSIDVGAAAYQEVVLVASVPLSAEAGWEPLAEGELIAIAEGQLVDRVPPDHGRAEEARGASGVQPLE